MQIAIFEAEEWERDFLRKKLSNHHLEFYNEPLNEDFLNTSEAEIASVFVYSRVNAKALKRLPGLKFIATRSTGFDHLDLASLKMRDIRAANVPSYGENTVAEHTFALILALSRKLIPSVEKVRRGDFVSNGIRGFDLGGKTIGIIGTGKIGSSVAKIASSFGMKVLGYDKFKNPDLVTKYGLKYTSLNELLKRSDVISLNCRHTTETHHLINKETIKKIKKGAYLVNTARGGLIDTPVLLEALDKGILAGAGLDVLEEECSIKEDMQILSKKFPKQCLMVSVANNILMRHPNVVITPHNAFNSKEAIERILETTVENIKAYAAGKPINLVSEN